jgi:hypothetical protein
VCLFTNNWQTTASYLNKRTYETYGLWYMCTRFNSAWFANNGYGQNSNGGFGQSNYQWMPSDYCTGIDYDSSKYITAFVMYAFWLGF